MEETLKELREKVRLYRIEFMAASLLCTILGIILVVWTQEMVYAMCKGLAVVVIITGIVEFMAYGITYWRNSISMLIGIVLVMIGVSMFIWPWRLFNLIPLCGGVVAMLHGMKDIIQAIESKESGYQRWWIMLIIAALSIIVGVICIFDSFMVITLAFRVVGVGLIYDGLSDLWIAAKRAWMQYLKEKEKKALESEYKEVE